MHSVVLALVIADIALRLRVGVLSRRSASGCMARESSCRIGGLWAARSNLVKLAQSIRPPLGTSYVKQNNAVEAVDQLRSRIDGLQDGLLDLHRMPAEVINEEYGDRPTRGKNRSGNWRRCSPLRCWSSPTPCAPRYTQSKNWSPRSRRRLGRRVTESLACISYVRSCKNCGATPTSMSEGTWGSAGPSAPPNITFSPS